MYTFRVRIRSIKYLWGGPDIKSNFISAAPLYLTVRVDEGSHTVNITQVRLVGVVPTQNPLGRLAEGQVYTIALNDSSGVFAKADDDNSTFLTCTLHGVQ